MRFDFVTVGFGPDLALLRLQARSMGRFLDAGTVGQILVVENGAEGDGFPEAFAREVLPEYGPLAGRVRLLRGAEVRDYGGAPLAGRGWRRQQGLKLDVHRFVGSEAYVTLDCKNHFIRPTDATAFAEGGRLRVPSRGVQARQMGAFRYFGVAEERWPEAVFGISTPFPLWRAEVAALDEAVRARGLASAGALPVSDDSVVEYRLYGAFLFACRRGWEAGHVLSAPPAVTFHARATDRLEAFLAAVERPAVRMMGVHRRAMWCDAAMKAAIVARWIGFGLVRDAVEGEALLTPPEGAARPV